MVDLNRPTDKDTPYIILESLNSEKNSSRTIHTVIINSEQTSFSLGRGHDSELRINDISVSRKHASLEYKDGYFLLTDLKSKFGTLMLLSSNVELDEQTNKTFQVGRTVVTVRAKCETPWRRGNNERGVLVDNKYKGEELQRMEELLRDTKSLGRKNNYDQYSSNAKPSNYQRGSSGDIDYDPQLDRVRSSDVPQQERKVIEIDGKRYIVLKELENDSNEN